METMSLCQTFYLEYTEIESVILLLGLTGTCLTKWRVPISCDVRIRDDPGRMARSFTSLKTAQAVMFWRTTPMSANAPLVGSESEGETSPRIAKTSTMTVTLWNSRVMSREVWFSYEPHLQIIELSSLQYWSCNLPQRVSIQERYHSFLSSVGGTGESEYLHCYRHKNCRVEEGRHNEASNDPCFHFVDCITIISPCDMQCICDRR